MPSYRLLLEYDGTDYAGWQWQPDQATVQGEVEQAVARVMGHGPIRVVGSGRTDSGVHALGQVASFASPAERDPRNLRLGLNSVLPRDICCRDAQRAPDGFDARKHAKRKLYRYRLLDGNRRSALRLRQVACEPITLDVAAMARAAAHLVGTHDFTSFRAAGSDVPTSVRTLHRLEVARVADEIVFEVEGDGFLRAMVRIIVGTLVEVGRGRRDPESLLDVLAALDRSVAGRTALPQGLCLVWVEYPGLGPWGVTPA
ncbi:MAG: tRNA pseudouridine(38-40) synthase TruA [Pseudomonadota bacterium]